MSSDPDYEILEKEVMALEKKLAERTSTRQDLEARREFYKSLLDQVEMNKKLKEDEEKYRSIMDNMAEGYYEVNLAGNFLFCNAAATRIYGYSPEELIGMNFREHMNPENAAKVYDFFNRLYRMGEVDKTVEYEVIRRDGTRIHLETSVSLMKNESGDIVGFRGIARDITERKNLEKALKESEELYKILYEHAGFPMTLMDYKTGKVVAFNKKAHEDLGYGAEEFAGLDSRVYTLSDGEKYSKNIQEIIQKGAAQFESKIRRKDGEVRHALRSAVVVKLGGKKYVHGIRVDITEQKRIEKSLVESESRFRSIFETAADPILLCDGTGQAILNANTAACRYSEYTKAELLGMTLTALTAPQHRPQMADWVRHLEKTGNYFFESQHITRTGRIVPVEINSRIITELGNKAILSIVRDVTARKAAEAQLARYRAELEATVQEKNRELEATQNELIKKEKLAVLGQLTATVSHELRNPLAVIQSSNFYLQRKIPHPDERIKKHLIRVDEQVGICDAIVADLLEYTRGTHAQIAEGQIGGWINTLIDRVIEMEKIHIDRNIPKTLPKIFHDQLKMQRAIFNILDNALHAVKSKKDQYAKMGLDYHPEIRLSVENRDAHLIIEIKDNGIGMDPTTREQAFDPLFTTRATGTGLGLANVRKIVQEHGGWISLVSLPGEGTSIALTLPKKGPEKGVSGADGLV